MRYPMKTAQSHTRYKTVPYATIELHAHCNRDCDFCPRFLDASGERKDQSGASVMTRMATDKVYWLLDELATGGFEGRVCFHRLSDPLIDKRYADFAEYAAARGMKVFDSTNGDVLRQKPDLCKRLDGVVDTFYVGLYDYETHAEKLEEMVFWKTQFTKTNISFSTPYEGLEPRQFSETYDTMFKDRRVLDLPCPAFRDQLRVNYNGAAHLCCQDDYGAFGLGDVFKDGLDHILFSDKRRKINDDLDQNGGRLKHPLCAKCYIADAGRADRTAPEKRRDQRIRAEQRKVQESFKAGDIKLRDVTAANDRIRREAYEAFETGAFEQPDAPAAAPKPEMAAGDD